MAFDGAPMGFYGEAVNFGVGNFLLPPSSQVAAYVCSSKPDESPQHIERKRVPTLKAAFNRVKASRQDYIVVLPGHAESGLGTAYTTTATQLLVAGTTVIGYGHGTLQPTLTWTDTTDTLAISVANVRFSGIKFNIDGANDITKGINVTGTDCQFRNCRFSVSAGTDLHATIGIEVGSAAHRFQFIANRVLGIGDAVTDCLLVVGATPPSDVQIEGNRMSVIGHVTKGLIHFTVAALRAEILNNHLHNTVTDAEFALVCDAAASRGYVDGNRYYVNKASVNANVQGTSQGAGCLWHNGLNYCNDEVVKSGVLSPAAAT